MTTERHLDDKLTACDYIFLDQHPVDRVLLKKLSKLEAITEEDARKYIEAEDALYFGLQSKHSPEIVKQDSRYSPRYAVAAPIIGTAVGFITGIIASTFASGYNYEHSDLLPLIFGFGGGFLTAAIVGAYGCLKANKRYKTQIALGNEENLKNAYQEFNATVDNLWEKIKRKRTKKGELGEVLQKTKEYIKVTRDRFLT